MQFPSIRSGLSSHWRVISSEKAKLRQRFDKAPNKRDSVPTPLHQLFNERTGHVDWYPKILMDQRAFVQNGFGTVQSGYVGALEKFPDGNLIVPEQRFSHGGLPVRRVVRGVVLELLHARLEPLVGIAMIVRDARAEDVQQREALMLDALLDQLGELLLLGAVTAGDERSEE